MILGVPFDGGIRMMQRFGRGVAGACDGPEAILRRLKNASYEILDLSKYQLKVTDDRRDNSIAVQGDNETIIAAHSQIEKTAERFSTEDRLISVGGDHSITYPLVKGLCKVHNNKKIGLIYIDAHFDLRPLETHVGVPGLISSGNPFFRIIEDPDIPVFPENMVAIGIHHSNTLIFNKMRQYAESKGMTTIYDHEAAEIEKVEDSVGPVMDRVDGLYLSLDIDAVFGIRGVSAAASVGISREVWLQLIQMIMGTGKVIGADLVETSSRGSTVVDDDTVQLACDTIRTIRASLAH